MLNQGTSSFGELVFEENWKRVVSDGMLSLGDSAWHKGTSPRAASSCGKDHRNVTAKEKIISRRRRNCLATSGPQADIEEGVTFVGEPKSIPTRSLRPGRFQPGEAPRSRKAKPLR